MKIAGHIHDSIVDGPGLRFVVFAQGCDKDCEGCHNPEARIAGGGFDKAADDIIREMLSNPLTDGLTLSGGEPFLQAGECVKLATAAKSNGLGVWVFTGYTFEELMKRAKTDRETGELMELAEVLIDGPFILAQRSLELKWRGSRNQRVINLPKSLFIGEAVEVES